MKIRYDIPKLMQIINDLSTLTGISMAFLDTNYRDVYKRSRKNDFCTAIQKMDSHSDCIRSDKTVIERCRKSRCYECHICYAGLYDAAMPIIKDGIFVGVIIMGRVRRPGIGGKAEFMKDNRLRELYYRLPELCDEQIASIRSLLPNILFQNAIIIETDSIADEIARYIKDNLTACPGVDMLCSKFSISRNCLYKIFRDNFDCTVNEYITACRIEKAKALLRDTKEPVYIVAEKVGIENYTYFCRLFKRREHISPTMYRHNLTSD